MKFFSLLLLRLVIATPVAPRDATGKLTFLDVIDVANIIFNNSDPTLQLVGVTCIPEEHNGAGVPYQSLTSVTFEARNENGYRILPADSKIGFGTLESSNNTFDGGEQTYKPLNISALSLDLGPAAEVLISTGIFKISPTATLPNIFHEASLAQGTYTDSDGTSVDGPIWTFSLDFGSTCTVYMDGSSACSNVG